MKVGLFLSYLFHFLIQCFLQVYLPAIEGHVPNEMVCAMMSLVIRHPPFSHFIAFLALLHRCLSSPTTTAPCDLVRDRCDLLRSHRDPTQPPRDLRLFVAALAPFGNPG